MFDPSGFADLAYSLIKDWKEKKVAHISPLQEIEKEPAYIKLKEEGCLMNWSKETRVRQLTREGWKPVVERDAIGRCTIFMDEPEELLLIYKPKA